MGTLGRQAEVLRGKCLAEVQTVLPVVVGGAGAGVPRGFSGEIYKNFARCPQAS